MTEPKFEPPGPASWPPWVNVHPPSVPPASRKREVKTNLQHVPHPCPRALPARVCCLPAVSAAVRMLQLPPSSRAGGGLLHVKLRRPELLILEIHTSVPAADQEAAVRVIPYKRSSSVQSSEERSWKASLFHFPQRSAVLLQGEPGSPLSRENSPPLRDFKLACSRTPCPSLKFEMCTPPTSQI